MLKKINKPSMRTLFFIKSFFKNLLLLLLPLSIIVAYSLYSSNKETSETINIRNWNLMYQIKSQMDSLFFTVNSLGDMLTTDTTISKSIRQVFLGDDLTIYNSAPANNLSSYLSAIISSNEYSHSAFLYFDNHFGRYIATSNGLTYIKNDSNNEWLKSYKESSTDLWCEATEVPTYSATPSKEVLAIYKKLYSPYFSNPSKGVLVTLYSVEPIRDYIHNLDLYPGQIILFLQDDGTILFQSNNGDFSNILNSISDSEHKPIYQLISEFSPKTDTNYLNSEIEYNEKAYVASIISSSENGWYYLSLVPSRNLYAKSYDIILAFSIITFLSIVISIILSMLTARREYLQLLSIIETFNNADIQTYEDRKPLTAKRTDPYQVILNNIIKMFVEQNYLQVQITNKQYKMELLELRSLQQQINPHFLFNTLNTIYWEAIGFTNKPNTCSAMIFDLTKIMEYSLKNVQDQVSLSKELEYLKHYTNIQSMRYKNKFKIIWDIHENALDYSIIKMVLQPLVENSINHGIKPKETVGTIKIKVYYRQNRIKISIIDNGIGISQEKLNNIYSSFQKDNEPLEHIGLINTNRRLILFYGESAGLHISSHQGTGTIISFSIPAYSTIQKDIYQSI